MADGDAPDLPFLSSTAWTIAGILAVTGPLLQWLAPPETGWHPYLWASLILAPALALAAVIGPRDPRWAHSIAMGGAVASSIVVAWVSPEPIAGGLLRPVVALPLWVAAAVVPFPRLIIALGAASLGITAWVGRGAETGPLASSLIAHFAAAALAVGIAYGWRRGRIAAITVGRLSAEVEHRRTEQAAMRRFLHRAAHELRTPLVPLTLLPAALEKEADPVRRAAHVEKMADRLHHVTLILDRMARLSAVGETAEHGRTDLVSMIDETAAPLGAELDLPTRAPAQINAEALQVALDELLANAKNAMRERLRVTVEDTGDTWTVHVDDDGAGIPVEARSALMEPFARVDLDLPPQTGTGLGLAIAQTIALNALGDLTLDESDFGGLRASLRLPKA